MQYLTHDHEKVDLHKNNIPDVPQPEGVMRQNLSEIVFASSIFFHISRAAGV